MFNSGILDIVIGMVVIYLQLSLVCTAVNELFASKLKSRANELERGISKLLSHPQLVDKFYTHPLIQGLRPDGSKPSYIPARTFALTILDIVRRHSFDGTVNLATQRVSDLTVDEAARKAALDAATTALTGAQAVRQAADQVLAAGIGDRLAGTKAAQDAANEQAKAEAAQVDAQSRLTAATQAKTDALAYLTQLKADAKTAKDAETAAQAAEKAAKLAPKNQALQEAAKEARRKARDAADVVAPSATSLLTEARDKVATVQNDVVPPQLKTALLALMDNAGTNLTKAQGNLEQWFDDAMDRVSGVYKRKSQRSIVIIAVLVTVFANVDSLQVADTLSHDKALRETLVAAAPELARADADAVERERATKAAPSPSSTPPSAVTPSPAAGAAKPNPAATATPNPSPTSSPSPTLSSIRESLNLLKKFGLPIGYIRVCTPSEEKLVDNCPSKVEAAVIDSEATLKQAQADLDKSTAALQKMDADKTALEAAKTAAEGRIQAAKKAITAAPKSPQEDAQKALTKAQEELNDATKALTNATNAIADLKKTADDDRKSIETSRALASAQIAKANTARAQALQGATAAKQIEADAVTAEANAQKLRAEAQASPEPANKQDLVAKAEQAEKDAEAARRKADNQKEMLRIDCPKCRKESELSTSELKQRLPTTHGYELASRDFVRALDALVGDSLDLAYSHWLGWLLTVLAISLGAPFWFDTLNRLMVIRSTVKPHEKSKEQESKDNPDEKEKDEPNKG
jgi:hypothetical protein